MITNWNELTVGKWQEIIAAESIGFDWYEKDLRMLSILEGIPFEDVKKRTIGDNKIQKDKMSFLNETPTDQVKEFFTIEGVEYHANIRVEDKTAGQFIDLTEFTKENDKVNENLHKILAVICLAKGSEYNGATVQGRAELFQRHLTMDIAYPLAVFFYTVYINTLKDIADFSASQAEQMSKDLLEEVEGTKIPTDGSSLSIV